jgi:hypothetical protein
MVDSYLDSDRNKDFHRGQKIPRSKCHAYEISADYYRCIRSKRN